MHSTISDVNYQIDSSEQMNAFGEKLGRSLRGGEVIELIGDVGAGKTTFTKGLALGLDIHEPVQSPTFTISRVYQARDGLELRHYDFYRLSEAGIMADELSEALESPQVVCVVEWSGAVEGVLPEDRLQIVISPVSETARSVILRPLGETSRSLSEVMA